MPGVLYARVSGAWVPITSSGGGADQDDINIAHWNSAWGLVLDATDTTSNDTGWIGTTPNDVITRTFTVPAGRQLLVYGHAGGGSSVASTAFDMVVTIDGVMLFSTNVSMPQSNVFGFGETSKVVALGAGTHTIKFTFNRAWYSSGDIYIKRNSANPLVLVVHDIGPVTPVSIAPPDSGPSVVASGNALGIVAMGSFTAASLLLGANTTTQVTNSINFTPLVGRRYRAAFGFRGAQSHTAARVALQVFLRNGTTQLYSPALFDMGPLAGTAYEAPQYEWTFTGDGTAKAFNVACITGTESSVDIYTPTDSSFFYLEDVGPTSVPALPIPETPPAWTTIMPGNGWINTANETPVAYRKIGDVVYLRGMITGGALQAVAFTLPVGFRPPLRYHHTGGAWSGSAWGVTRGLLDPDGTYRPWDGPVNSHTLNFSFSVTP